MGERRKRGPRHEGRQPKHSARALARHLAAGTLDRRTWIARELEGVAGDLEADRGGRENCTAAERLLIERAAASTLILRAIEAWVFTQPAIVVGKRKPQLLGPLAKGYTSHLATLTRALTALGLRPDKVARLPDLGEYLETRTGRPPIQEGTANRAARPQDDVRGSQAPNHAAETEDGSRSIATPPHGEGIGNG